MGKEIVNPDLGRRLRHRIAVCHTSVAALAREIGATQQTVDEAVQGHVKRPGRIVDMAQALRTTPEWLQYERGPEEVLQLDQSITEVKFIDWVSAGDPKSAPFESQDQQPLLFAGLGKGKFFATRVDGDSMDRISPSGPDLQGMARASAVFEALFDQSRSRSDHV